MWRRPGSSMSLLPQSVHLSCLFICTLCNVFYNKWVDMFPWALHASLADQSNLRQESRVPLFTANWLQVHVTVWDFQLAPAVGGSLTGWETLSPGIPDVGWVYGEVYLYTTDTTSVTLSESRKKKLWVFPSPANIMLGGDSQSKIVIIIISKLYSLLKGDKC